MKKNDEKGNTTKSRPIHKNHELLEYCKKKKISMKCLKGLLTPSKSPWFCVVFYVCNSVHK